MVKARRGEGGSLGRERMEPSATAAGRNPRRTSNGQSSVFHMPSWKDVRYTSFSLLVFCSLLSFYFSVIIFFGDPDSQREKENEAPCPALEVGG